MKSLLAYILFGCCLLSTVIGWLLWTRKQPGRHANRLLATLLFTYVYIDFVTLLITNGGIVHVPHLFRTAAPLNYLVGPLIYLYARASLLSTTRFDGRRYGWLLLPFLLNVVEFLPFYVSPATAKLARLQQLASAPNTLFTIHEGLLPPHFHLIGYSLSSFVYSLLAAGLWWTYRQREGRTPYSNPAFGNWLKTFVLIHLIVNGVWLAEIPFIRHAPYGNLILNITYLVAQLVICFYIIQRPTLLYGAFSLNGTRQPLTGNVPDSPALPVVLSDAAHQAVPLPEPPRPAEGDTLEQAAADKLAQLDQYMHSQQPYLRPRLSLADVSVATQIPPYLLSAILNRVLGLDFRDYVNAHRVRHLCQLLESNQYSHLTLEGISTQVGFSSKTTFYRAFQKHMGVTPAQYMQRANAIDN
ncbi:helix-turn-helix domain-containing protein [Fibrella aestuarina]|uniref:helix-turn-helix domain-containing protein n=1 Tax=Fibrella aestuarina TaxID=651143 RepID=UPI00130EE3D1|nr:AraC family transcriptional regulator [Fibrella aestuarina]